MPRCAEMAVDLEGWGAANNYGYRALGAAQESSKVSYGVIAVGQRCPKAQSPSRGPAGALLRRANSSDF